MLRGRGKLDIGGSQRLFSQLCFVHYGSGGCFVFCRYHSRSNCVEVRFNEGFGHGRITIAPMCVPHMQAVRREQPM